MKAIIKFCFVLALGVSFQLTASAQMHDRDDNRHHERESQDESVERFINTFYHECYKTHHTSDYEEYFSRDLIRLWDRGNDNIDFDPFICADDYNEDFRVEIEDIYDKERDRDGDLNQVSVDVNLFDKGRKTSFTFILINEYGDWVFDNIYWERGGNLKSRLNR